MVKKGKKGKKGAKGKKGKKGVKKRPMDKMEKAKGVLEVAGKNSNVWELRVKMAEEAKEAFRSNALKWMDSNKHLEKQMIQTERDTVEVISFLKKQDADKDKIIETIENELQTSKHEHRKERDEIVAKFSDKVNGLEDVLAQKQKEIDMVQNELRLVKEFRRKRNQMQKELDDLREQIFYLKREHETEVRRMEQKFLEEKSRLQLESDRKIAELADRAHKEAIKALGETTRTVYKENVRITTALDYHMKHSEKLQKQVSQLKSEKEQLLAEREQNEMVVLDKVAQAKKQKDRISQNERKINTLETALTHLVREFQIDKKSTEIAVKQESESSQIEIEKLHETIDMQRKEMLRIRKLAKNILDQRTDLERFFHDCLAQVRQEILAHQEQYKKDAQAAYRQKLFAAYKGEGEYPKVRTFGNQDFSSNSVLQDFEGAASFDMFQPGSQIDISDLTWEQKERVIRLLFAKMNGMDKVILSDNKPPVRIRKVRAVRPLQLPAITESQSATIKDNTGDNLENEKSEENIAETFVTQGAKLIDVN